MPHQKLPTDNQDGDNYISPEANATTTHAQAPPKKRGRKAGSSLELANLQSGGTGGLRLRPGQEETSAWIFNNHLTSDESSKDDSSFDGSDESDPEDDDLDVDFEEDLDWCVSHLEGNRILPIGKLAHIM